MGAVVRVHRPALTAEERAKRMERIKEAVIKFHKEVKRNEKKSEKKSEQNKEGMVQSKGCIHIVDCCNSTC